MDMREGRVNAIVPVRNRAGLLTRAVHGILNQSHGILEAIVVVDGSTDDTWIIATALAAKDARVATLRNQDHRGAGGHTQIRAARGDWIAFLDADAYWLPSSVKVRLAEATAERAEVVHSDCLVDRPGQSTAPWGLPALRGNVLRALLAAPSPMFQGPSVSTDVVYEDSRVVDANMDLLAWLRKRLEEAEPEVLREMVKSSAEALMGAEADALSGAAFRERSGERVNRRNGYRERPFDTRTGTIALAVPKLRSGSYFPGWLLVRRRRAERALIAVVSECYVRGVSTRRVDGLVKTLGIEGISKSQVSEMAKSLDEEVAAFPAAGPWTRAPTRTCGSTPWP
jgi:glycosyltransferase involved in cell wall biosynthesis